MSKTTKASNKNMSAAKSAKNDEFYTRLADIEKELYNYRPHFEGKTVLLNCDDPRESKFFFYFSHQFELLKLKRLISVGYKENGNGVKFIYDGDKNGNGVPDTEEIVVTEMEGNGGFQTEESIELLKETDIVVGNPPFSLWKEYLAQIIEYDKKFLIIGNNNAITYKEIFPLIKENRIWLGVSPRSMSFVLPDGTEKLVNACWFTNLTHKKRNETLLFHRNWNHDWTKEQYKKYDNYNALNVDKVADIPEHYEGVMGVPITFLSSYNPDQFEILGSNAMSNTEELSKIYRGKKEHVKDDQFTYIDGKKTYARIFIRFRK